MADFDPLILRAANAADEPEWRRLWAGYTAFYRTDLPETVTRATWTRAMDPASGLLIRVAAQGAHLAGFALAILHPGSWTDRPICYLEDLFVDPDRRGGGVGRALIDDLLDLARQRGWSRLYWHTERENHTARRLYDQYISADDFVRYRIVL